MVREGRREGKEVVADSRCSRLRTGQREGGERVSLSGVEL